MQKKPPDHGDLQAPPPAARTAAEGMTEARTLVRRYLPDVARFLAGVVLSPESEAGLHTKVVAAGKFLELGGVLPQPTPSAPAAGDGAGDA